MAHIIWDIVLKTSQFTIQSSSTRKNFRKKKL